MRGLRTHATVAQSILAGYATSLFRLVLGATNYPAALSVIHHCQVRALAAEQGGGTPAVAVTDYARSEDRLKVILAGFQVHMAKPVDAAELLALVASLAGRVAGH